MSYRIPLPDTSGSAMLDIIEPNSTAVQRFLRRDGLAAYEPPTAAALLALFESQRPGFVFMDVGANVGLYAMLCAALFDPGAVYAFEPTPQTAQLARRIAARNDLPVDVRQVALGDRIGTASLHLSNRSDASNSLVEGFKESASAVEIQTTTLDQFVSESGRVPDIVKIDVETFEPQVLTGASETIRRHRPTIVIEVLKRRGHDHGEEISAVMAPYGYSYYRLGANPGWKRRPNVAGNRRSPHNDWLLGPAPLPPDFGAAWASWRDRLDLCGPERNSRVPIMQSVKAAARRGGAREVVATGQRYVQALRRERRE